MSEQEKWSLTLNKYQRDNLVWLLALAQEIGADTGDWLAETMYMLDSYTCNSVPDDAKPNISLDEWRKQNSTEIKCKLLECPTCHTRDKISFLCGYCGGEKGNNEKV